ncbi:restriction endonuclease subunit S [Aeromonas caviae]|uniref:Restriction endonuclease subunit S n=1 Tax=Aeromonas taiwanensis TaxID=633417 RepID=A0A5F0KDR7_9GAMM|nr:MULTISPECIES: restriction endonuclease subunit S [Aeromonas]RWT29221.1 type I restriction endonuclease subunit S [Aeromonas caviae]TFF79117.1 restriction endonuclease subunit S [Aeromonas taiwanensis]TFF79695.1 restriction endonuclease subunit S [Aeromonas taiwanensis]TFF82692.1 restriction endonuclease subunit S [Aeromonas taiwanensis]
MSEVVATAQQGLAGNYHPYPEYKDSGVEWLDTVPSHWDAKRLGQFLFERREKVSDKDYAALSVTKNGILPQLDTAAKSDAGDNRKLVKTGDFVINSRSDRKGSSGISERDGSVSLISIVMEPKGINHRYIHHLLRSYPFQEEFYRWGKGIVADLWSTNYSEMKNIILPIPTDTEQRTIAAFLDYETSQIDRLISLQQRLIELLKEKRQAVISHAVTKGLNPDAPMKDSGVEWLGQVPEHWVVSPLKYKCEFSGGGTPSKDNLEYWNGSIPWVSPKDMKSFWITDAEDKITEQAIKESSTKLVQPGAVLMVVRSGILQRTIPVGINTIPVTMNQDMKAIRFSSAVYAEWLSFFIKGYEDSLLLDWRKQGATVESIEHEYLANSLILFPPEEEARSIIAALGRRLDKFDQLEQRASDAITLLQERRSALISAAVTGKIDLRGWTPPAEEVAA